MSLRSLPTDWPIAPYTRPAQRLSDYSVFAFALPALFISLLAASPLRADNSAGVVLAVISASTLESSIQAVAEGAGRGPLLPVNTLLAGQRLIAVTADRPAVWSVEVLDGSGRQGFVLAAAVTRLSRHIEGLQQGERSLRRSFGRTATRPPLLIKSHENDQLREAWEEATEAIAANDALPATQRIPDPFLARAEVYMQAGDVVSALDDCASASAIATTARLDTRKQQQVTEIYTKAITRLRSLPQPPKDAFTDIDVQASEHFNASKRFLTQRDFEKAVGELAKALSLKPSQPLYWYMRAIARRESGDLHRAQSDALMGAFFERRLSPPARHEVSKGLSRMQGPSRLWLEAYRRGKADLELLGLEL
jgi:tetratricopeptide (TPR) repeat protein